MTLGFLAVAASLWRKPMFAFVSFYRTLKVTELNPPPNQCPKLAVIPFHPHTLGRFLSFDGGNIVSKLKIMWSQLPGGTNPTPATSLPKVLLEWDGIGVGVVNLG